jgi:stearoyl-CoA desaturase (delta-9 desaturase)
MVFKLMRESWDTFVYHYKEGNMNWPMVIYLVLTHTAAMIGLSVLSACKWQTLALAFILWPITGLGITAGVHRLWAHRSYRANTPYRVLLMLMNSIANQGPIYHWARDHRVHHKFSETDADPHNATRGFFFAHMGWLLVKKHPK